MEDIIRNAVDGTATNRTASGVVEHQEVTVHKRRHFNREDMWYVVTAQTDDGVTAKERFDDEAPADNYFDGLIEKYDLEETTGTA